MNAMARAMIALVALSQSAFAYQWRCEDCLTAEKIAIAAQLLKNEAETSLASAQQALGGIRLQLVVHQQVPNAQRDIQWVDKQASLEAEYAVRADQVTSLQDEIRLWVIVIDVFTQQIVKCDCWR